MFPPLLPLLIEVREMKNNYCVYKHTTPNGKVYIGITSRNPEKRWGSNGINYRTQVFYRAVEKYGWSNILHEILYFNLTKEEAEQKEIELITKYQSNNKKFGYNIDNGGHSINSFSEEHRKKISDSKRGKTRKDETKKKISETLKKNGMSEDNKRKIIEANKNRIFTDDAIKRISNSSKNRKYTKEQIEYRNKMIIKAKSHLVYCVELDMIFGSVPEAIEYVNSIGGSVIRQGIHKVLKGMMNMSGQLADGTKLHWKYVDRQG